MEDSRLSSRKFLLAAVAVVGTIPLVMFKYIDVPAYVEITKWVIGLYLTGNVAEKIGLVVTAK